jgi:hypothetical protein
MSQLVAKPVVKNKFWIVEEQGTKVATIQAVDEGGFVYVHEDNRERFGSIKLLSHRHGISFIKPEKPKRVEPKLEVYNFPTQHRPYNSVLDVQRYLPIYSRSSKSKSFYCAGYYWVKQNRTWTSVFCPKLITLNRYEYIGPFQSEEQLHKTDPKTQ